MSVESTSSEQSGGWFALSVGTIDKHLPEGWEATCAGSIVDPENNSGVSAVRIAGPDGSAYRLYGCEQFGFRMTAGEIGGEVSDLDSNGEVTSASSTEAISFEAALKLIVEKAQEDARGQSETGVHTGYRRT